MSLSRCRAGSMAPIKLPYLFRRLLSNLLCGLLGKPGERNMDFQGARPFGVSSRPSSILDVLATILEAAPSAGRGRRAGDFARSG
jgi:hypothetical protein